MGHSLWFEQAKAMGVTIGLAVAATALIGTVIRLTLGLRPDADGEEEGLDQVDHGESGYHEDNVGRVGGPLDGTRASAMLDAANALGVSVEKGS